MDVGKERASGVCDDRQVTAAKTAKEKRERTDEMRVSRISGGAKRSGVHFCPVQKAQLRLGVKVMMRLWGVVQGTVFAWSPGVCRGFRRFLLQAFGARVSRTASIHNRARIECPWNLEIEDFASIGENAWVYALDRIQLGKWTCVSRGVSLITGTHDCSDPSFTLATGAITTGTGVWVAAGAMVLPGVVLGDYCVIGAGSVVTRDMPEMMVCGGNPCRPIKKRHIRSQVG